MTENARNPYEEWLWQRTLEEEPPQDDGDTWLVHEAWRVGYNEGQGRITESDAERRLASL